VMTLGGVGAAWPRRRVGRKPRPGREAGESPELVDAGVS
jgi:hypothetical protein